MNQTPLNQLQNGDDLAHLVRLEKIELAPSKTGKKPWLKITIADSTGRFFAKKWQSSEEELKRLQGKKYLFVTGKAEDYQGKLSAVLTSLADPDVSEEDLRSVDAVKGSTTASSGGDSDEELFTPITKADCNFEENTATQTKIKDVIELPKGTRVDLVLRYIGVEARTAKTGNQFLIFKLGDSSGTIEAKKWSTSESSIPLFEKTRAVRIVGETDDYQGTPQIKYDNLHPISDAEEPDVQTLYEESIYELDFLKKQVWGFIKRMKNPWIKKLATDLLAYPIVKERFSTWVAATKMHHAYRCGLITHVYRLMVSCELAAWKYNNLLIYPGQKMRIDKDILLMLALGHDMFKITEYNIAGNTTDDGRVSGHLVEGAFVVRKLSESIEGFPKELAMDIWHGLLGHHGRLDWGSPMKPLTPEGILFHYIDNEGSKIDPILEASMKLQPGQRFTHNLDTLDRGPGCLSALAWEDKEDHSYYFLDMMKEQAEAQEAGPAEERPEF